MGGTPGLEALVRCGLGVSFVSTWEGIAFVGGLALVAFGQLREGSRVPAGFLIRWVGVLGGRVKARSES